MLVCKKRIPLKYDELHSFHLVNPSPWPFMTSVGLLSLALNFVAYFHYYKNGSSCLIFSFLSVCLFVFRWLSDVIVESTFEGHHTNKVQIGIKMGMCLFIISESMFFFSFFWSFCHSMLISSTANGCIWPPIGISSINPWGLPLLNTSILLSSGITITCSHRAILAGNRSGAIEGLSWTLLYGVLFSSIQVYEYNYAPFSINDGIFGSLFFMLTGFHGLHVVIGSIFILVCLIRHINYHFTCHQHVGLECCIWYWHFVDAVWLSLFILVYIWGG